ncbi:acyltransferase family protein [uncultured Nocardioides sp.]|uniref:acyltransferase family protein n=1 Tax=uncultured Nocardioides sp. TaxID=198441 RepID=UPI002604802F|nr:acyltransferase family protein [uncultured Nocardioides sp.]
MSGSHRSARDTVTAPRRAERGPAEKGGPVAPKASTGGHGAGLRLDIEGLRGIAVLTVLLYHLGAPVLSSGFAGVDIFFVISGYLITGLLIREAERSGRVSMLDFYARRARRLLPAASLVLLVTAAAGWWLLPGSTHVNLGRDVVASTLYVLNWELAARSVDYLAEDAAPSALQHYWSLSVEEQFYVVWPLLILLCLVLVRRFGLRLRPTLIVAIGGVGVASFGWSVYATAVEPATAYFVTTTRVWELAVGAGLAIAANRLALAGRSVVQVLAWLGAVGIVLGVTVFSGSTPWPGYAAALPVLGTAALIAAGGTGHSTLPGRALSWRPLVWIGGLSYATYLWHWPLIVLSKEVFGKPGLLQAPVLAAASIGLAWLTGKLVERPVRFHPALVARPLRSLLVALVAMAVTCAAGVAVALSVPTLPAYDDVTEPGARALVANPDGEEWTVISDPRDAFDRSGTLVPDPSVATLDQPLVDECQVRGPLAELPPERCTFGDVDGDVEVAMMGDSKMVQWFPALDRLGDIEGWRIRTLGKAGCVPSRTGKTDQKCDEYSNNVLDSFAEGDAPDRVIISVRGAYKNSGRGFAAAIDEMQEMGIDVVLLADNPGPPSGKRVYQCVDRSERYGGCGFDAQRGYDESGLGIMEDAAEETGAPLVDLNPFICPESRPRCSPAIGGVLVYRQSSHLTQTYVYTMLPMLHRELARLGWSDVDPDTITLDLP